MIRRIALKLLLKLSNLIGLLTSDPQKFLQSGTVLEHAEIEKLIVKRNQARDNKDFKLSDLIRDELLSNGVILEDNKNGTSWRKN